MPYFPLTETQETWLHRTEVLAAEVLAPLAAETDRSGEFPHRQLAALRKDGFFGLRADPRTAAMEKACSLPAWSLKPWPKPVPPLR